MARNIAANPNPKTMTPEERKALECFKGLRKKMDVPYYSRGYFVSQDKDGGNLLAVQQGTAVLFNYGEGQSLDAAIVGDRAALSTEQRSATIADTNLISGSETVDGVDFIVCGVGFFINPGSDGEMIRKVYPELAIELAFGRKTYLLVGPPSNAPGGGGLNGAQRNDAVSAAASSQFTANGFPDFANVFRLPHKLRWQKPGLRNSNFNVKVHLTRDVSVTGAASTPTNLVFDFLVKLYGYETGALAPN